MKETVVKLIELGYEGYSVADNPQNEFLFGFHLALNSSYGLLIFINEDMGVIYSIEEGKYKGGLKFKDHATLIEEVHTHREAHPHIYKTLFTITIEKNLPQMQRDKEQAEWEIMEQKQLLMHTPPSNTFLRGECISRIEELISFTKDIHNYCAYCYARECNCVTPTTGLL